MGRFIDISGFIGRTSLLAPGGPRVITTSDDTSLKAVPVAKPKIGLALGGGVGRGWAHIGVIRALEAAGIKPDVVAGTSIGALVGGAYLAGHLDTLEEWARSLNRRRMLGYLDFTLGAAGGFLGGARLEKLMHKYLGETKFEDLDTKFVSVTAELATAHEIWIDTGSLVEGIKASYALPGVFPPSRYNDRLLVDGALVNPVPASVCRAFGARVVIAVSLHGDSFGHANLDERLELSGVMNGGEGEDATASQPVLADAQQDKPNRLIMKQLFGTGQKLPGAGTVMVGALNIVMDRLSRSRLAGDPPDVLVMPRVGHISLLDFDRADETIKLGLEAMEKEMPQIEEAMAILSR